MVAVPPNILFILADDLGHADLGCYGSRHIATPALDALAAGGVRLTQAYANSPVCSATRTALMTGRYPHRLAVGLAEPIRSDGRDLGFDPATPSLPARLRATGYRTSLIGKWHLGTPPESGPLRCGYDRFFGFHYGAADYFTHSHRAPGRTAAAWDGLYEGEAPVTRDGYLTDVLADAAIADIADIADGDGRPFFLSLHFNAPHWPWLGPDDRHRSVELSTLRDDAGGSLAIYGAMVAAMDAAVGRVLAALDGAGLSHDTLVVFTSDNGGERFSDVWPFIGAKGELLEGGLRVPAIVRWPGRLPAGSTCAQVAMSMDWAASLLAAAGAADDTVGADGLDLLPALAGGPAAARQLFWRYRAEDQAAVREGDWKYLRIGGAEYLFDLAADVRERANLAGRHPDRLERMRRDHAAWDRAMLPYPHDQVSESPKGRYADRY
jgi:arylsulfatase A-like enzyme